MPQKVEKVQKWGGISTEDKNGPTGQQSERQLATTSRNNYKANWNRRTGRQTDRRTGPRIESG